MATSIRLTYLLAFWLVLCKPSEASNDPIYGTEAQIFYNGMCFASLHGSFTNTIVSKVGAGIMRQWILWALNKDALKFTLAM